jgi:hypothetical protein
MISAALALTGCGGSSSSHKVVTTPASAGTSTIAQPLPIQQQRTFGLYGDGIVASCVDSHNHPDPRTRSDIEGDVDLLIPVLRSSNPRATITLEARAPTVRAFVERLVSLLKQCDPAFAGKLQAAIPA